MIFTFLTFALLEGGVEGGRYKSKKNIGNQSRVSGAHQSPAALQLASGIFLDNGVPHYQDSALLISFLCSCEGIGCHLVNLNCKTG